MTQESTLNSHNIGLIGSYGLWNHYRDLDGFEYYKKNTYVKEDRYSIYVFIKRHKRKNYKRGIEIHFNNTLLLQKDPFYNLIENICFSHHIHECNEILQDFIYTHAMENFES